MGEGWRRAGSWSQERGGTWDAPGTTVMFCLCFLQVNNLSQRELAISVHFWVPILLNGVVVWDVALVAPSQVPTCLPSLPRV